MTLLEVVLLKDVFPPYTSKVNRIDYVNDIKLVTWIWGILTAVFSAHISDFIRRNRLYLTGLQFVWLLLLIICGISFSYATMDDLMTALFVLYIQILGLTNSLPSYAPTYGKRYQ
jgi:CHASE2 domain-containing sensor protein